MSYSKCFVCGEDNYSGNDTRITVERKTVNKDTLEHTTTVWTAHVCDSCLREHFGAAGGTCEDTGECRWFCCSACGFGFGDIYINNEHKYDAESQPNYCPNCGRKVVGE